MSNSNYIPTPFKLRWRHIRYQLMPVLTMLICSALAGWLWVRHGGTTVTTGAVNALRVSVNSDVDGVLVALKGKAVELFQVVKAGDAVAQLDQSLYLAQIGRLERQIKLLHAELSTLSEANTPTTAPSTGEPGAAGGADLADQDEPPLVVPRNEVAIRLAIASHEAKIQELNEKVLHTLIRAPIGGTVVEVHRRPGQAVQAGQSIITIASADGQFIVAYVRQEQAIQPKRNMPVDIRIRSTPPRFVRTEVADVGPQFERIPDEQAVNHRIPEWGLPVHILIPKDARVRPGELVDVFFRADDGEGS